MILLNDGNTLTPMASSVKRTHFGCSSHHNRQRTGPVPPVPAAGRVPARSACFPEKACPVFSARATAVINSRRDEAMGALSKAVAMTEAKEVVQRIDTPWSATWPAWPRNPTAALVCGVSIVNRPACPSRHNWPVSLVRLDGLATASDGRRVPDYGVSSRRRLGRSGRNRYCGPGNVGQLPVG